MSSRVVDHIIIIAITFAILLLPTTAMAQQDLSQDYNKVLFSDDFENGNGNWELASAWQLVHEGNNTYLAGDYSGDKVKTNWVIWYADPVHIRAYNIDNYTMEAAFKLDSGMVSFNYRDVNQPSVPTNPHYSIQVRRTGSELSIDIFKNQAIVQPTYKQARVQNADGWHKITITGRGTEIQVKLDDQLVMTYVDDHDPYLYGGAAFEIDPGTRVAIDNFEIRSGRDSTINDSRFLIYAGCALVLIVLLLCVFGLYYLIKRRRKLAQARLRVTTEPSPGSNADKNIKTQDMLSTDAEKARPEPENRVVGHDVFISYSHEDKPMADAICAGLESEGIKCWIAPRDVLPGAIFQEAIIDAIDASKVMVMVYSSKSNHSPHVVRELSRAIAKEVIIIPFRIEDVPLSKSMEYLISVPHWLDALSPPVERHIEELVRVVKINIDMKRKDGK